MSSDPPGHVPFQAHAELLRSFLQQRAAIVERIQGALNAQQKPAYLLHDRAHLARQFEDCFFAAPLNTRDCTALRGQLQMAHWADGFRPREMPGIPNEMFDPSDMMARAFQLWQQTRWPGRNARVRFAQTLFNLYMVRGLTLLNMRMWDAGPEGAGERLGVVQQLLDLLWRSSPADQPVLVRDARWLVPVAQSPTTDELAPYFRVAEKIAGSLQLQDRLEIHKAAVAMAGGHLRSQLRHFTLQGTPLDDHGLLLATRRSNALDCGMTIQGLLPLLEAYDRAVHEGHQPQRSEFASIICQGISPDPELYVNRLDLLAAYSMIEHLFVTCEHGDVAFTAMGKRHVGLVRAYTQLMNRLAPALAQDCAQFVPVRGEYSPYGVLYGFSSNLLEHMTMKALQPEAEHRFSLEDVFASAGPGAEKLAWVSGWRKLPHMSQEIQKRYEYPQQFAEVIFGRIMAALQGHAAGAGVGTGHIGRLWIATEAEGSSREYQVPPLQREYVFSSDSGWISAHTATPREEERLRAERNEGEYLVSFQTAGGWTAVSKDVLTDVLGSGRDAALRDLPMTACRTLRLMYPGLVAVA